MKHEIVSKFIEARERSKLLDEELKALETLIFQSARDDERINIIKGRQTITIKDETYANLEIAGIETEVVETRKKKLEEFDIEVQKMILSNEENIERKISKESIRIK